MKEAFIGIFAIVLFITAVIFVAIKIESLACEARAVSFKDYSYGPIQGCMVNHNDRWLPLENIRGFDDKG